MQQAMEEITDYLAAIDEKVDDILRAQKDAVLSRMVGVGFELDEAMFLRPTTSICHNSIDRPRSHRR